MHGWLTLRGIDDDTQHAAVLALNEACANAIEHAYRETNGSIVIQLSHRDDVLRIAVEDQGTWRQPTDDPNRGRGILLMRNLMSTADIRQQPAAPGSCSSRSCSALVASSVSTRGGRCRSAISNSTQFDLGTPPHATRGNFGEGLDITPPLGLLDNASMRRFDWYSPRAGLAAGPQTASGGASPSRTPCRPLPAPPPYPGRRHVLARASSATPVPAFRARPPT